jgi:hypothetical protein
MTQCRFNDPLVSIRLLLARLLAADFFDSIDPYRT